MMYKIVYWIGDTPHVIAERETFEECLQALEKLSYEKRDACTIERGDQWQMIIEVETC